MIIALLFVSLAATLAQAAHVSGRAERSDFARALAHTAVLLVVAAAGIFVAAMMDR